MGRLDAAADVCILHSTGIHVEMYLHLHWINTV